MPPPSLAPASKAPTDKLNAVRESAGDLQKTLALVWASSPAQSLALAAMTLAAAAEPLSVAYAGKRIVDAAVARL